VSLRHKRISQGRWALGIQKDAKILINGSLRRLHEHWVPERISKGAESYIWPFNA
jgi:hypothetical protein